MKRLFAFLAICLPIYLFAQGFGSFSHDQPFFAKDLVASSSPTNVPGLWFRWVASDLASNTTVTTWTDRIQNNTLVKTGPGTITNAVNAVRFPGGNNGDGFIVTNGVGWDPGSNGMMVIFNFDSGNLNSTFLPQAADAPLMAMYSDNKLWWSSGGYNISGNAMSPGVIQDFIATMSESVTNRNYTNGVFATGIQLPRQPTAARTRLGTLENGFWSFKGSITEICIWTNHVFTVPEIELLHRYRTNTYGGSP